MIIRVRRSSVSSASAWYKADPSSILETKMVNHEWTNDHILRIIVKVINVKKCCIMPQNLKKLITTMFQSHLQLWGDGETITPGDELKSFCGGLCPSASCLCTSAGCLSSSASCLRCCYRGVLCRHGYGCRVSSGQLHILQIFLHLPRSEKGQNTL